MKQESPRLQPGECQLSVLLSLTGCELEGEELEQEEGLEQEED